MLRFWKPAREMIWRQKTRQLRVWVRHYLESMRPPDTGNIINVPIIRLGGIIVMSIISLLLNNMLIVFEIIITIIVLIIIIIFSYSNHK